MRTRSPQLEEAYRQARYRVELPSGPVQIGIGAIAPADRLRLQRGSGMQHRWVFLTPCNPASRRASAQDNRRRIMALQNILQVHGWRWLNAAGVDPKGRWPEEPGVFLVDVPLPSARALGRRFGQNAIVTGTPRSAANLVWL